MSIQVPLLVIDPEMCLGHVYIVLKPVGSARLTFDGDIVLYELCMLSFVGERGNFKKNPTDTQDHGDA